MMRNKVLLLSLVLQLGLSSYLYAQQAVPLDTVLASTEKTKVTYEDFLTEMSRIPEKDRFEFLLSRQRLGKLVENILINKTMAAEATALGLDKSPSYQAELRTETMKMLAKYRGKALQENAPKVDLERRAREIYLVDRERFRVPVQYDTWHILIDFKGRTKEEAYKRAEEARKKVLSTGPSEELAITYSNDGSAAQNKGRLGFVPARGFDPAYARAVEKLKIDQVSEVVESKFGYHVIVVKAIQPETQTPFEQVKGELIAEAEAKYLDTVFQNHVSAIRSDPTLKTNVDVLEKIRPAVPIITPAPPTATQKNK
jgi:peptidyl-prolyl cis-trans isomerase C